MVELRKRVEGLTTSELWELTRDYETLETKGAIGECKLRTMAEQLGRDLGSGHNVVMWMRELAFEAFRLLAYSYAEAWMRTRIENNEPATSIFDSESYK